MFTLPKLLLQETIKKIQKTRPASLAVSCKGSRSCKISEPPEALFLSDFGAIPTIVTEASQSSKLENNKI